MKGIFFTIITFMIFLGMITYITVITNSNIQMSNLIGERISANRIYYTWRSVSDNMKYALNAYVNKINDTAEINDTLPATSNIVDFLKLYQQFINQTYRDPTIDIRFEDSAGNEVDLSTLDPKTLFQIKPMNINYGYLSFGKNEVFIRSTPSNFSFIKKIDLFLKMKNVYFDCDTTLSPPSSDDCNKWAPYKSCVPGSLYCLEFNLTFQDVNSIIFNFPEHYFDVSSTNSANLNVKNVTGAFSVPIQVGPLGTSDICPSPPPFSKCIVLDVDLHNVQVDTFTKVQLNTSDFYINLASILNVSTVFGKKVDNI